MRKRKKPKKKAGSQVARSKKVTAQPGPRKLIEFDRFDGQVLRVTAERYRGFPYLGLRVWEHGRPTQKGLSVRLKEIPDLLEAIQTYHDATINEPIDSPFAAVAIPSAPPIAGPARRPVKSAAAFDEFSEAGSDQEGGQIVAQS